MIRYLYLALEKMLLAINDEKPKPQPVFKHCDLWNLQVEFLEKEAPFQTPAVFVEFTDIQWRTDGQHIQDADLTIRLHIVTPWYANTASDVIDREVRATALSYLDIPTVVFRQLHGKHGTVADDSDPSHPILLGNFNALTRTASTVNHNHERFVDSVETYQCHLKDLSYKVTTFAIDTVNLTIEFDPHPGQAQ